MEGVTETQEEDEPLEQLAPPEEAKSQLSQSILWMVELSIIRDVVASVLYHAGVWTAAVLRSMVKRHEQEFPAKLLRLARTRTKRQSVDAFCKELAGVTRSEESSMEVHQGD